MSRKPEDSSSHEPDLEFEERVEAFERGEIELSDEDFARLEAEDPDGFAIARYLDPGADPAYRATIEERARTDPAFGRQLKQTIENQAWALEALKRLYDRGLLS